MLTANQNSVNRTVGNPRYDLHAGTRLKQNWKHNEGLVFEIKEIDRNSGKLIVEVISPENRIHQENWTGDIELLENALDIKEYVLI